MNTNYRAAMYLRLSKEDGRHGAESGSISLQRLLLSQYAEEHFPGCVLREYIDR